MESYAYPGNIRELENLIERIIVLDKTGKIGVGDLPEIIRGISGEPLAETIDFENGLNNLVEDYEKNLIIQALEKNKFNKFQTAKMLNMNRSTFMSKLKKYDIK